MSDVFVSYRRDDKPAVSKLVSQLRAAGLAVWWDDDIPPNAAWEETIETALADAKVVIVAWSEGAVQSENVKGEARRARQHGKLIQVFLQPCEPPLFFGERQGIDLVAWSGDAHDPRFQSLVTAASAVRDGKLPPKGSGHIPKRPSRWPLLSLPLLLLFALPVSLDWSLAARIAVLAGAGYLLWRGRPLQIAAALTLGLVANVGLDVVRYRLPGSPYYLVSCSLGDVNCLATRHYVFGKRTIDLHPMFGGQGQLGYVRLLAGRTRSDRAYLEREKIGEGDALLSPAEMSVLRYLDGGAPSKNVAITYQPFSRRLNPTYPYGNLAMSIDFEFHGRPDTADELKFSAGFAASADAVDLFDPTALKDADLTAPVYTAVRATPQTFGFATPIDTRDEPSLWRRAVLNDQLFQLYAASDLDVVLSDLSAEYPALPESERLLYDALVLSYWCGRNTGSGAVIACAQEMSRIAKETDRLAAAGGVPAKLQLTKQILRIVGSSRLLRLDPDGALPAWAASLSIGPFTRSDELRELLLVDLLDKFPDLKPYLTPIAHEHSEEALLDPVTATDQELAEYLKGLSGLGRTDALQALLPLQRTLAEAYANTMVTEDDLFQWARAFLADHVPVDDVTKVTAARAPQIYGQLRHALDAEPARSQLRSRYLAVDAAVKALGGTPPEQIVRSRAELLELDREDKATAEFIGNLVARLDKGSTFSELVDATKSDAFQKVLLPTMADNFADMAMGAASIFDDAGLPVVGECLVGISTGLNGLRALGDKAAPAFLEVIKGMATDRGADAQAKLSRVLPKQCLAVTSAFKDNEAPIAQFASYIGQNPMLQDPQAYLAADKSRNGLVSSRQYLLSATFELASRIVDAGDWLGESDERAAAAQVSGLTTAVAPLLTRADFSKLKNTVCAQWREPVWAYSEMNNASVGWRRVPLFLSILRMSEVCQGAPTKAVLARMDREFGDKIVRDYLAEQRRPESRVQIGGHLNPDVLPALAADDRWSAGDAYLYAQASIYKRQYDELAKFRSDQAQRRDGGNLLACPGGTCGEGDRRAVAAAITAFIQSVSTPSSIKPAGAADLFRYKPAIGIDEDAYADLVAEVVPPIPAAISALAPSIGSDGLKALADPLLNQPGDVQYSQLEQNAARAPFQEGEANAFWFAVQSLFARQSPLLAVKALDHVKAVGLTGAAVSIRRSQLLASAGKTEEATKSAIDLLKAQISGDSVDALRLALENGMQIFDIAKACAACRQDLAPAIFSAFTRLDALHGNVRDDDSVRLYFAQRCVESTDPKLNAAAHLAADAVFSPRPTSAPPLSAEDLTTDIRYRFALQVKADLANLDKQYADDADAKAMLAAVGKQPNLKPIPDVLDLVSLLSTAAASDRKAAVDDWAARSAKRIEEKLRGAPDPSLLDDLAALGGLTGFADPRFEAAEMSVFSHFTAAYARGDFGGISPLNLIGSLPQNFVDKHPLPVAVVRAYLLTPAFAHVVSSCKSSWNECRREGEGLVRYFRTTPTPAAIIAPNSREAVIGLGRNLVSGGKGYLPRFADFLPKALDEPKLVVLADLLRDETARSTSRGGDFVTVENGIHLVMLAIVEHQTTDMASASAPGSLDRRMVVKLIDDYLPGVTTAECCGPVSPAAQDLFYLITAQLGSSDRCEWIETRTPIIQLYFRQMEAKGVKASNNPTLAKLIADPSADCAGKMSSDRIAKLNETLKTDPNSAESIYARGKLYQKLGETDRALADFDAAARMDGTKTAYQNARCWYRALDGRELDTARSACDAALRIKPGDPNTLDSRGMVGLKQSRFQDAWNDYDAATRADASKASYRFGRGIAALRLGKDEGYADLAAATKLDPAIRQIYAEQGVKVAAATH